MQSLLLKAANGQEYLEEYNICEVYKDDLDVSRLQAQSKLLPEFLKSPNLSLSELINSFRALPASK